MGVSSVRRVLSPLHGKVVALAAGGSCAVDRRRRGAGACNVAECTAPGTSPRAQAFPPYAGSCVSLGQVSDSR